MISILSHDLQHLFPFPFELFSFRHDFHLSLDLLAISQVYSFPLYVVCYLNPQTATLSRPVTLNAFPPSPSSMLPLYLRLLSVILHTAASLGHSLPARIHTPRLLFLLHAFAANSFTPSHVPSNCLPLRLLYLLHLCAPSLA